MNVLSIVKGFLERNKALYDGLVSDGGTCACTTDDLEPCGELRASCEPGYAEHYEAGCGGDCGAGGGCDFHIFPGSRP